MPYTLTQEVGMNKKHWKSLRNLLFGSSLCKDFERNMMLLNEFFTTMHIEEVCSDVADLTQNTMRKSIPNDKP